MHKQAIGMEITETPPSQLSERRLFTEYVELLDAQAEPLDGYDAVRVRNRQTELLAEIGERLEALEAAKSLICDAGETCQERPPGEMGQYR
jgi:hypothetical protein